MDRRGWAEAVTAGIDLVGGIFGYFTKQSELQQVQGAIEPGKMATYQGFGSPVSEFE